MRHPILVASTLVLPPIAQAQDFAEPVVRVLYTSAGINAGEQYGYVSETIADLTGDGVPEILNSAPFRRINGQAKVGVAFVHDGRTGAVLATHTGQTTYGFFGWRLGALGDIDADGVPDYAVGAAGDIFQPNLPIPGEAFIYSGADHSLIRRLDAADYAVTDTDLVGDRFGQDISAIGDIDADGHDDFIVTADLWDEALPNAGMAWVLSGADFSVIRTHAGAETGDRFGASTNPVGDINADGVPEYLVSARDAGDNNQGIAHVYDGATGAHLFALQGDSPTMTSFGQYFASSPGDCTGDGVPDIFVSDFLDTRHGAWTGAAYLFDTAQGLARGDEVLLPYWSVVGDETRQSVGFGGGVGDVDADGCADIATCFLSNTQTPETRWAGIVRVYSGRTGKVLRRVTSLQGDGPGFNNWGEQFGYSISPAGDADADGTPDMFVTAGFGKNDAGTVVGRVYAIAGEPPCDADFDGDLRADITDVIEYLALFVACAPAADLVPPQGSLDFSDIIAFLGAFGAGCP